MNVAALLAETAARSPDKPALLFQGRPITYAQLDDAAGRAAAALIAAGIEPGDRVALVVGNVPEFVVALYGTFRAGAVAVPLNVMLTAEEIGYILADAGATALVAEMSFVPTVLAVRDRLPDLSTVFVVTGPPVPPGTVSFEQALDDEAAALDILDSPDGLALVQYTSGTTAEPRGAMLEHEQLIANMNQLDRAPALRVTDDDVVLVVLPLFHIYGLNVVLGTALRAGATCVLVERFDPDETLALVERHGVTLLPGAPTMFASWLDAPEERQKAFASVRMAVSGAAPLGADVFEAFRERFGTTIWDSYGLTEAGPAVTSNAAGADARAGSIGHPLRGVDVRLVDENGEDVEEGDPGEIVVRGPNVFRGYWRREEDSRAAFLDGEWLRTGDVAMRDEDGYLYLADRKKDLIIVSGFNVYPREVEEALTRLPEVAEAGVVGVPDERTGEAVKALVVLTPGSGATAETLIEQVGGHLARFKVPREVEIVPTLPKVAMGKVLRRALRGEEDRPNEAAPEPSDGP